MTQAEYGFTRRVLIMPLAGGSEVHDGNLIAQRDTWAREDYPQFPVRWIFGGARRTELTDRDLIVEVEEGYSNLLRKTLVAFEWALENYEFDAILRTNTSNYFDFPVMRKALAKLQAERAYAGPVHCHREPGSFPDDGRPTYMMASGSAMYLSRDLVTELVEGQDDLNLALPDDVAIAAWMNQREILPQPLPRSNVTDFEPLSAFMQIRVKHWSRPHVTQSRMRQVHALLSSRQPGEISRQLRLFDERERRRLVMHAHTQPRTFMDRWTAFGTTREDRLRMFVQRLQFL